MIINADDFGLTKEVSNAIIEIYKKGSLSSTTLMVNMPGTDHAIALAKENPGLGIGLHFNITEGRSALGTSSLTDSDGNYIGKMPLNKKISLDKVNKDDIEKELVTQFKVIEESGIKVTHIDSHQHIHMHPKVFPLVADFAKSKDVNIRIAFPQVIRRPSGKMNLKKRAKQLVLSYASKKNYKYAKKIGVKSNASFNSIFDFHPFQLPAIDDYKTLMDQATSQVHELMIHPYILSDELKTVYNNHYNNKLDFFRKAEKEFEVLSNNDLVNKDLQLITFSDI